MTLSYMTTKDFAVKLRIPRPFKDYGETCVKLGHLRNEIA